MLIPIERSDDNDGNIGKVAKTTLKRLPSSVYWQDLSVWRIRTFRGGAGCLEDIDWENDLLRVWRSKACRTQTFPLVLTKNSVRIEVIDVGLLPLLSKPQTTQLTWPSSISILQKPPSRQPEALSFRRATTKCRNP